MNSNAFSMYPPLQPWLSLLTSQSTSSCSDRDTNFPVFNLLMPSTAATAENAQQLPASKGIMLVAEGVQGILFMGFSVVVSLVFLTSFRILFSLSFTTEALFCLITALCQLKVRKFSSGCIWVWEVCR